MCILKFNVNELTSLYIYIECYPKRISQGQKLYKGKYYVCLQMYVCITDYIQEFIIQYFYGVIIK